MQFLEAPTRISFKFKPYTQVDEAASEAYRQEYIPIVIPRPVKVSCLPRDRVNYLQFVNDFHTMSAFYRDHPELIPKELDWEIEVQWSDDIARKRRGLFNYLTGGAVNATPYVLRGILDMDPPTSFTKHSLNDIEALNIPRGSIL